MIFVCRDDNDLWRVAVRAELSLRRCPTLHAACEAAAPGEPVLVLADDYPRPTLEVDDATLARGAEKGLRLYVEYPARFPGFSFGEPASTEWERVAVSSDFFSPQVDNLQILGVNGCWYLPVSAGPGAPFDTSLSDGVHLALARIAGYDRAVFGLPEDAVPILIETRYAIDRHIADPRRVADPPIDGEPTKATAFRQPAVLLATTSLSRFVTGRYAPTAAWRAIWKRIFRWLLQNEAPELDAPELDWEPAVRVAASRSDALPGDAERRAFERSVAWFNDHALFLRDWRMGVIEGYQSKIDHNGRQYPRVWVRADCLAESAMVFAHAYALTGDLDMRYKATQIMEYLWSEKEPDFLQCDPESPAYGLVNWYERGPVFYGDDNARVILPSLAVARLLDDTRWDERILRCILANLRTTGRLGFRRDRIDRHRFDEGKHGWRKFASEEHISYAPHYQSYLWAIYLWMYGLTGDDIFLSRTLNAVRMTVDAYPNWKWSNGITQEIARMLLPLGFLNRIAPSPEHRSWLDRMAGELLAQVDSSGAIREKLGPPGYGIFSSPTSNEAYGVTEAPVIQQDGDPACDLLYTVNFAFLGLREAARATGDPGLEQAEDRLADFLCRIQIRSEAHPYLDGTWMRSFDYRYWEYWGSSADAGWGPWCVESGWCNAWIASVLAMRCLGETLYHDALGPRMRSILPNLLDEMELDLWR